MVTLRKIEPEDLPFLYKWENDAAVWAVGNIHNPISRYDLRGYVASSNGDIFRDGQLRLIIQNDGATAGCVDLYNVDARNRTAAIGMYVAKEFRSQHVGRQAIEWLIQYAFSEINLRMMYALISANNTPCIQLYKSLGFSMVGPLQSWTLEGNAWLFQLVSDSSK